MPSPWAMLSPRTGDVSDRLWEGYPLVAKAQDDFRMLLPGQISSKASKVVVHSSTVFTVQLHKTFVLKVVIHICSPTSQNICSQSCHPPPQDIWFQGCENPAILSSRIRPIFLWQYPCLHLWRSMQCLRISVQCLRISASSLHPDNHN